MKLVVFPPPLVVILVSYCNYYSWTGINAWISFTLLLHLEFLEGRGLIFIKMRQICIKDELKILQKTIKVKYITNIFVILFLAQK